MVRRYVEDKLLHTSRRYVKKFGDPDVGDSVVGYKSFSEVCRDLDGVVNVLWLSGTRGFPLCPFRVSFIYLFINVPLLTISDLPSGLANSILAQIGK
jgi:hypothetical protein